MRTITLYRHGVSMGTPSAKPNKNPPKRGEVNGWSSAATRRNINFLRSIDENAIQCTQDGELLQALALTLTLRDCPDSHDEWHKLRRSFIKRLERLGLYRSHWVTEWQRRGVPHLHGAFWFPMPQHPDQFKFYLIDQWLDLTYEKYGARPGSQYVTPIYDSIGWFKYLAKHAARGLSHYQRSPENVPQGWKKTGRIWGHTGKWPTIEPDKHVVYQDHFFRMRRYARAWRKADARKSGNRHRISQARRMLKHNDPELSKLRGVSEWIPDSVSSTLLDLAARSNNRSF